ncbi:MAG: ABC transporter ATP-binding protein [Deltaproteobacteria bacterium]|nr:ABC transporter ATP-binding protein [Deltaproteobacteria bacterium]
MTMLSGETVLTAMGLRKSYGRRVVLDGVSLTLRRGEMVGLLGPNGAGKTTILSILATLLRPDGGEVRIAGIEAGSGRYELRRKLGFVPQSLALYPSLTPLQNLELFARLHRIDRRQARIESMRMLEEVGLTERAHDQVATLSGGMKRRLNLACGLVHRPDVLLLDEPSVGVDPQSREQILLAVRRSANAGAAVIYSTHYMEEVERTCDRILLIDRGQFIAEGTTAELIGRGGRGPLMEISIEDALPSGWYGGLAGVVELRSAPFDGRMVLQLAHLAQVNEVLDCARAAGVRVVNFAVHSPNLSDAFMALTGRALRDANAD